MTDNVTEYPGGLPDVELHAMYEASGEKVKCFRKYVQIRLNDVKQPLPSGVSVTVDDESVEKDLPCHRYYTIKEKKITLLTKHFSTIKFFNCNTHQGSFGSHVTARIYKKKGSSWDKRDVKVLLIPVTKLQVLHCVKWLLEKGSQL